MAKKGSKDVSSPEKTKKQPKKQNDTKQLEKELAAPSPGRLTGATTTVGRVTQAVQAGVDVTNSVVELKNTVMNLYSAFEGAAEFCDRHRTLELLVVNGTQQRLIWEESFFDSGTTFAGPTPMNIMPISEQSLTGASLWAVANSKKSILTGVSGAGKWRIEGSDLALAIGFTNPQIGATKSAIGIVGRNAPVRVAYDACEDADAKQYSALGYVVGVYADHEKAGGQRRFVYCIAEAANAQQSNLGERLQCGESMPPGGFLLSRNGRYVAIHEINGGLAVYDLHGLHKAIWRSPTGQTKNTRCALSGEGLFSVRNAEGRILWVAPWNAPAGSVGVTDEGALVLRDANHQALWSSR
ncbi:hypothetical protein [Xanthomonas sp. D-109]|uniref:hypothetical protein n=1 Tax=Xanthomonas sp. D-109 TaxID=2821274 RepID=UPI001AD9D724|nr:hypothetical protein [Xanthomonas sp. D-109]MBO9883563.1 hypothetical protein [Xanthomonas sp. D-109]